MNDKIILENGAGAFLKNNGVYLLMKRAPNRKTAPNVWSCVGGHFEQSELNDPMEVCLREVKEETGIPKDHIYNLKLSYIIIRQYRNIIRQNYIYFGETDIKETIETEEGTLHWIPENELLNREYTKTYTEMVRHFLTRPHTEKIVIGIAESHSGKLNMKWCEIDDFE